MDNVIVQTNEYIAKSNLRVTKFLRLFKLKNSFLQII